MHVACSDNGNIFFHCIKNLPTLATGHYIHRRIRSFLKIILSMISIHIFIRGPRFSRISFENFPVRLGSRIKNFRDLKKILPQCVLGLKGHMARRPLSSRVSAFKNPEKCNFPGKSYHHVREVRRGK